MSFENTADSITPHQRADLEVPHADAPVVVDEIRALAESGYREVVLSGINLGMYGRDLAPRVAFHDLLRRILDETPLERLRISSIEPQDVTQDLIDLFASTDRIAQHFHMPLQSGSDRILAAMHRWYRAEHYARRVELIRERLPHNLGISGIAVDEEKTIHARHHCALARPATLFQPSFVNGDRILQVLLLHQPRYTTIVEPGRASSQGRTRFPVSFGRPGSE